MFRHFFKNYFGKFLPFCVAALLILIVPLPAYAFISIENILMTFVNVVFGWMVWLGGMLLDYTINTMVIGFGETFTTLGIGLTVDKLWTIVRDFFNLTFIFGLVFIGLRMIFDSSNSSNKKMLISLVIAALLVNFSLLITKTVVDFSNIAASQLVNTFPSNGDGEIQVSGAFMDIMGLTGVWNTKDFSQMQNGSGYGYVIGTMLLYIIAAFVFLGGGILLMLRFVSLVFYMILSPLMFLGFVFPQGSGVTKDYWSGFLKKCFFAPAYFLMLFFSYEILTSFALARGNTPLSAAFGQGGGDNGGSMETFASTLPPFIITAMFMIASLVIAQKMGANGADGVMSAGKTLTGKAKGYARSAAGGATNMATYLPRAGARYGANALGNKGLKSFESWQANAQSSAAAAGAGTGAKLKSWIATRNVTDRAARGTTEALKKVQLGTGTTNEQEDAYAEKMQARINQKQVEDQRSTDFERAELEIITPTSAVSLTAALESLGKTLQAMTKDEKAGLGLSKLKDIHVAANLADEDIEHFEKSGKFSAQQIQDIKSSRKAGLTAVAAGGNTFALVDAAGRVSGYGHPHAGMIGPAGLPITTIDRRQKVVSQGVQTVGKMPVEIFKQASMYQYLTPAMVEERIKKGVNPIDKAAMRAALEQYLIIPPGTIPPAGPWHKWATGSSFHAADFFA
jgi:hypothetical protein